MADTYTTNLNLTKPEPGAAEDTWGISLNSDLDTLDAIFSSSGTQINLNPNQINFADNKKAIFGTGSDLEIYHSGTHSYIADVGSGVLFIRGENNIVLESNSGSNYFEGTSGGASRIYYAGDQKLNTTSSGVNITGTLTSDGLTVDATGVTAALFTQSANTDINGLNGIRINNSSGTTYAGFGNSGADSVAITAGDAGGTGNTSLTLKTAASGSEKSRLKISGLGDISFYDDTGTSQNLKWDASADTLNFVDGAKAQFGTGNDLQIYHTGSHSYIDSYTGNLYINSDSLQLTSKTGGENYIRAFLNGAVDIYYDNAVKLATTSNGIDITGVITTDGLTTSGNLDIVSSYPRINLTDTGENPDYSIINANGIFNIYDVQNNSNRLSISSTGNATFAGTVTSDGLTVDGESLFDFTTGTGKLIIRGVAGTNAVNYHAGENHLGYHLFTTRTSSADVERLKITNNGDISFYDDTGSTQGLFWDASAESLGIGTSSPSTTLELSNTSTAPILRLSNENNSITAGADLGVIEFYSGDDSGFGDLVKASISATQPLTSPVNGELVFKTSSSSTSLSEAMRISADGSVGIGTDSPSTALDVRTSSGSTINIQGSDGGSKNITFSKNTGNAVEGKIKVFSNTMSFFTGTTEKATIDSSGNFGIGTTSPSQTLEVDGNIQATGTRSISALYDSNHYMRIEANSSGGILKGTDGGIITTLVRTYGDSYFNGGNVGIGTDSPTSYADTTLHVSGSTGSTLKLSSDNSGNTNTDGFDITHSGATAFINNRENGDMVLRTNNTEALRIDSSQRVGIGTSSPTRALDVSKSGSTILANFKNTGGTSSFITLGNTTSTADQIRVGSNGTALTFSTNYAEVGRFSSNGYFGIGTNAPSSILHVSSDSTPTIKVTDTTNDVTGTFYANNFDSYLTSTARLIFQAGGSIAATISASQKFGIGTTSPTGLLHTKSTGDNNFYLESGASNLGQILFTDGSIAGRIKYNHSDDSMAFFANASERARLDASGNFGIGTTSPASILEVRGDGGNNKQLRLSTGATTYWDLGRSSANGNFEITEDSGDTYFTIDKTSGNVGIGAAPSTHTLEVWRSGGDHLLLGRAGVGTYELGVSTDNALTFEDGGSERARIDSSGSLVLQDGTAYETNAPNGRGSLILAGASGGTGFGGIEFHTNAGGGAGYGTKIASSDASVVFQRRFNSATWSTSMKIDDSGNLLVGTTNTPATLLTDGHQGFAISNGGYLVSTRFNNPSAYFKRENSNGQVVQFLRDATSVGSISVTTSGTSYNTTSDARLKDVTGEARGLEVITKLNPVAYNWKADGKADEGLIAQEVKELVPNAVTGSEDEHYQMDYSKLVTHLVKGMKEQQEQIESLKSEIANLKGE